MLRATHRLFNEPREDHQEKTRLLLEKLLAVAQWGVPVVVSKVTLRWSRVWDAPLAQAGGRR
jgi:hypothetical protein